MTTFALLIVCLNPNSCPLPTPFIQSHFTADSIELCETNVATMLKLERVDTRQLKITCSVETKT